MTTPLAEQTTEALERRAATLAARLDQLQAEAKKLDLTRGKPATEQLDLSRELDGILRGDYRLADGSDARNYGSLLGIPEARALGAELLGVASERVIAAGNSSLSLMHMVVDAALRVGLWGAGSAWQNEAQGQARIRFICPVPGYDRHFTVCEALGIEMITVPMDETGPLMDEVERIASTDPLVKGIWCVPKYSNPTGCIYSDEVTARLARLPHRAGRNFLILWDNAYVVHDLEYPAAPSPDLPAALDAAGTEDNAVLFASTSKITFAGAGVAFLGSSPRIIKALEQHMSAITIGPDKVNQLRHVRFLAGRVTEHMQRHAELIRPKFAAVTEQLESALGGLGIARWTQPRGGYFISFETLPGLAKRIVARAKAAGVTLTPAGATYPYGKDPADSNIRIAPTFPSLTDVQAATDVFTLCVELESIEQILRARGTSAE